MHRRLTIIAILTAIVAAIFATPAAAKRSCGTERVPPGTSGPPKTGLPFGPGIPYKIVVWRGSVSCRKARSLIKATGEGKGTWHEAPDFAGIYTSFPGGWRCSPTGTGGVTAAGGAGGSGLSDTRTKSTAYSSSSWPRAANACTPL